MTGNYGFQFTEEEYEDLRKRGLAETLSVPEFVRRQLWPGGSAVINVESAIERALAREVNSEFTVPELFQMSEYEGMRRGAAGALGREFWKEVETNYPDKIQRIGERCRQTLYKRI